MGKSDKAKVSVIIKELKDNKQDQKNQIKTTGDIQSEEQDKVRLGNQFGNQHDNELKSKSVEEIGSSNDTKDSVNGN